MSPEKSELLIDARGRCAGVLRANAAVLVRALPAGHDAGFERSRHLGETVCAAVLALGLEAARVDALASAVRNVFMQAAWQEWHVSFCVLISRQRVIHVLNCGITGVACVSDAVEVLAEPRTLARRMRREGATAIPAHATSVAPVLAGPHLRASDIDVVERSLTRGDRVLAVADPRIFDLVETADASTLRDAVISDTIEVFARGLHNPERSFFSWSCE